MAQDPSSPDRNPFEVLGLQGTEELPTIRKAFLAIAARSHPDRLRMRSPEEKAQALELFLAAKKAFEVLSQPDKRREWAERLARARSASPPIPRTPPGPVPPPIPRTPLGPVPSPIPRTPLGPVPSPIPRTPLGAVPIPRTPSAPVTPPPEAPSAPPRPAFTPVHGIPVTSPPRPSTPPAQPSRGLPVTPPSRPGPEVTPVHAVPLTSASPRPAAPPASPAATRAPVVSHPTAPPPPRSGPLPAAAALQLYKLGLLALESADYAKALDLFAKASRLSPTSRHQAMELVARGYQYLSTRFLERARESFERALQLQPECREARVGLELLDKQSGRYHKGR